jgi:PPOX class probable F420-dependent enzyme
MTLIDTSTELGKRLADQLEHEIVVWLTTVDANGTPHPVPVWFLWDGTMILIYSRPNKPKLRHISSNPRVSLNFNSDPEATFFSTLTGTLQPDPSAPPATGVPAYVEKYREQAAKLGWTPEEFASLYPVALRFTPEQTYGY